MNVFQIQTILKQQGYNPGELDGVYGRRTIQAVKAFQRAHGLEVDGIVGPLTMQALTGAQGVSASAPDGGASGLLAWYEEARRLIGTKEAPGDKDNPKIIQWAENLNIDSYQDDDTPWCGLFVGHCIGATLPEEQLPTPLLMARSWRRFGEKCEPMRGAVLVFWRISKNGPFGHVGFYHSEDKNSFHVLGGNQSNMVNVARVSKTRLLAARWPRTAAVLNGAVVEAEGEGPLSHNED